MGTFQIRKKNNGGFQFNLKANDGQIILMSEDYPLKVSCIDGIQSVKRFAMSDRQFDKKTSVNGKYYFNLKSDNGKILGVSEMYETEKSMYYGIESVKIHAPTAPLEDLT
ncbi:MAG: YegP family protein [Bacteroidales bacterium]|jgi:uncharacterized protein YegP (UPF0339 family)|nr:YegP family protein [Bacteroidales bacterium]